MYISNVIVLLKQMGQRLEFRAFFLFAFALVFLLLFATLLPFNGFYGKDAYVYALHAQKLYRGEFRWPILYPLAGGVLLEITKSVAAMQWVSMLSFASALVLMLYLLWALNYPMRHSLVFLLVFALPAPYFARLGLSSMSDMFAIVFMLASALCSVQFIQQGKLHFFLQAGLFALLCFFTHTGTALLLFIPFAYCAFLLLHRSNVFVACFVLFLVTSAVALYKTGQLAQILNHELLNGWSISHFVRSEFAGYGDGKHLHALPNLFFVSGIFYHPGFNAAGIFFAVLFFLRKKKSNAEQVLFYSVLLYVLFLAGLPVQNIRLLTPAFAFVLLLGYPSFLTIYERFNSVGKKTFLAVTLFVLNAFLLSQAMKTLVQLSNTDQEIAHVLTRLPSEKRLYVMGVDEALKFYGVKNPMTSLWSRGVLKIEDHEMLLLNKQELCVQWSGSLAEQNLHYIELHCRITPLREFSNGYVLYAAEKK